MVLENKNDDDLLLSYVRIGHGKVSNVLYKFNIDKDYKAFTELTLNTEFSMCGKKSSRNKLNEEEINIVNAFIKNKLSPKKIEKIKCDDYIEQYEYDCILYDDVKIIDDDLSYDFNRIIDLLVAEHEDLSVNDIYNKLCNQITSKK